MLLAGCVRPALPFYYCVVVKLNLRDGRQLDALECWPREQRLPWDPTKPAGPELFG